MHTHSIEVERLPRTDLVAMAQCIAIDADAFPYASIPFGLRAGLCTWIARADVSRRVVGFIVGTARHQAFYVHGLAVAVASRRLGIGRALVRICISGAGASDCHSVVLHVGVVNRTAVSLYESEGFEIRRTLVDFYRQGVYSVRDAYEMALPLASSG